MRVAFAGTPAFAAHALSAILAAGYPVPLVLTQPDRPAGRGMNPQPSAVKKLALAHGLAVHQPGSLKASESWQPLRAAQPDVMAVAAYGIILPQAVLDMPGAGCINIHASLLPRWRGAAPIQRALLAGDTETGITIMRMDAGLDTGPVLLQERIAIAAADTAGSLHDKLAMLGARMIVRALGLLAERPPIAAPQPQSGVTYAAKLTREEAIIDWRWSAAALQRMVRAFDPFPGALARVDGTTIKVWRAEIVPIQGAEPGEVLEVERIGITVACGQGALRLTELQKAGGKRLTAAQFLSGFRIAKGARFAVADD